MTIDDTYIISAWVAVWAATTTIVAVLWSRIRTLEKTVAKLQQEKAEGDAAKTMLKSCPQPSCPFAQVIATAIALVALCSCVPKRPELPYDKRVLVVLQVEQPMSGNSALTIVSQIIKLIIP